VGRGSHSCCGNPHRRWALCGCVRGLDTRRGTMGWGRIQQAMIGRESGHRWADQKRGVMKVWRAAM